MGKKKNVSKKVSTLNKAKQRTMRAHHAPGPSTTVTGEAEAPGASTTVTGAPEAHGPSTTVTPDTTVTPVTQDAASAAPTTNGEG